MPTRRQFLKRALELTGGALGVLGAHAAYAEAHSIQVERVEVRLARLPRELDGFTIAQLSDLHYGTFIDDDDVRHGVEITNALHPNLVVLTGDYVTKSYIEDPIKSARMAEPCARLLTGLRAQLGVLAVLGNHDYWTEPRIVHRALESQGIHVLYNRAVPIEFNRSRFWIAGVGDVLNNDARLEEALARVPRDETTVLLAHEPDYADLAARYPIDLQLSGHSHGGQVRLPLVGPPILPKMGRKYPAGLRRVDSMQIYTNRGIGTIIVPARVNCPPEVTAVILRSGIA